MGKMEPIKFEGSLLEAKSGINKSHLKSQTNTSVVEPPKMGRKSATERMPPIKFEAKSGIKRSHMKSQLNITPWAPNNKFWKNPYRIRTPGSTNKVESRIKRARKINKTCSFLGSKDVKNKSRSFSINSPKNKSFKKEGKPMNKFTNKLDKVTRRNSLFPAFRPAIKDVGTSKEIFTEDKKKRDFDQIMNDLQKMEKRVKELEMEKEAWTKKEKELYEENDKLKHVIEELSHRNMENEKNGTKEALDMTIPQLNEIKVKSIVQKNDTISFIMKEADISISPVGTEIISGSMTANSTEKFEQKPFISCFDQNKSKTQYLDFDNNLSLENYASFQLEILSDTIGSITCNTTIENHNISKEEDKTENRSHSNKVKHFSADEWKEKAEKMEKELNFMMYIINSYNII